MAANLRGDFASSLAPPELQNGGKAFEVTHAPADWPVLSPPHVATHEVSG